MEKGGAIFPITFNDCGGIFPQRNFSGQKFSHTKSPPPLYGIDQTADQTKDMALDITLQQGNHSGFMDPPRKEPEPSSETG